ncbi:short-chain dehydrogenase/reductase SDR [Rhodopirellula maiorica SM1]|uniref:Short-chain dehydrogenase/reductase SDR n=1 Tax=Rhodopirellula maiorica SM1 TaxID=1265738 RepID=M5RWP8_9BACT|nr:SDR family NAD(P)-dependent oxidoreductase [Rhodopirellula maiorica]EMI19812.1 short-chain dehydrogenase/reductase SDR [Rhodopirellula maiorica SM1]
MHKPDAMLLERARVKAEAAGYRLTHPPDRRRVVLVTGASVGLGLALARQLIAEQERQQYHIVLTARGSSLTRFQEQGIKASETIWIRPLEVTDAKQRCELVAEIDAKLGGVDILINNAGVAYRSCVEHVTEPERLHQMNINFRSPLELIRCVLPGMRAKRCGRIVNISSVGGMMAMPTMSVYSASKFALEGASEALYYELKPWNVSVTLVQPGFMRSDAFAKVPYTVMSARASIDCSDPYHEHYYHMEKFIGKMMNRALATPDSVARKVIRIARSNSPPLRVYGSLDAVAFAWLRCVLPRRLYTWLLYRNLPQVRQWGQR